MALLFMDGFDHYGNGVDIGPSGKWGQFVGSIAEAVTGGGRTGAASLALYYINDELISKVFPASGGFVVGLALRFNAPPNAAEFLRIKEGTTNHLVLAITTTGLLQVKLGTTVLATGTMVLATGNWWYIEFKGVIHDTTGSYEVRVDGVTQPELTTAGPVDTRNGGTTGQWDRISVLSVVAGWNCYLDDLYVCDTSGTLRNTFMGTVKIETLMAQPGNGSNFGLTPSTGTDHGALVDEIPGNTTDFNSGVTVGLKDTYNLPSVTQSGTILAIQTNLYTSKSDAGARQMCAVVRTGGADFDGANMSPLTSFRYLSEVREQNPNTNADWTVADVNALEVGMKVTV